MENEEQNAESIKNEEVKTEETKKEEKVEEVKVEEEKSEEVKDKKILGIPSNIAIIIISVLAVIIIAVAALLILSRGEKATVKAYLNAIEKENGSKYISLIDWDAQQAYSSTRYDLSKFDDKYEDNQDNNKDKKEEIKEEKEAAKESFENLLEKRDGDKKPTFKIKSIETTTVGGSKKLKKVIAKITVIKGGEKNTSEFVFYVTKKGLKTYIAGTTLKY